MCRPEGNTEISGESDGEAENERESEGEGARGRRTFNGAVEAVDAEAALGPRRTRHNVKRHLDTVAVFKDGDDVVLNVFLRLTKGEMRRRGEGERE